MTRLPAKPKVLARHCWMFPAQKALRGSVNSKFTEPLFAKLDCVFRSCSSDLISSHIEPAGRAKVLDSEHLHDLCRIVGALKMVGVGVRSAGNKWGDFSPLILAGAGWRQTPMSPCFHVGVCSMQFPRRESHRPFPRTKAPAAEIMCRCAYVVVWRYRNKLAQGLPWQRTEFAGWPEADSERAPQSGKGVEDFPLSRSA